MLLYTMTEAAEFLRVSPQTLRKWRWLGKVPQLRVGSKAVFRLEDLEALIVDGSAAKPDQSV